MLSFNHRARVGMMQESIDGVDRSISTPKATRSGAIYVVAVAGELVAHILVVVFRVFSSILQGFSARPMLPPESSNQRADDYRP
ncbi:MAG: hypothetical protein JWQ39_2831 [Glaciihabitans sp.]|jgi:hypothetical protein|nr:hypothetical protein [Glaciihabitans sp.]